MRKSLIATLTAVLLFSACAPRGQTGPLEIPLPADNPVEGYAVLAEKDSYTDVSMTNLGVDYIDIKRLRRTLEDLGWDPDQIHDLKEFNRKDLERELDWLKETADANDLVFFYVTGHGNYLRYIIDWDEFFPEEWGKIPSYRRILVVDACNAAEFTKPINADPLPHLSLAAVDDDEYGWKGLPEEGLPIVGGVFTFYLTEGLQDPRADESGDGRVSLHEAALFAEDQQRTYMHEVVFGVEEFLAMYRELGVKPDRDKNFPDVIIDDNVGGELFLEIIPDQ
jgi:predicted small lipoprotein YifL